MASDTARRAARRLRRLVTGVPFLATAAVLAVLALAYTLAGFFLVPRLIATYVPRYAEEQLHRRAEIGEVRVNPLLLKLEIKHFRLQESDGRPLLGFDRLFVDLELSSLFRRAWTFAEVQLEAPRLDAVLDRDGRLNLAELVDAFPRSGPAPDAEASAPRRVLLRHAEVRQGGVSLTDRSGQTPQTARMEPIDIELRDITTLPERHGPYAISATLVGGGAVSWEGAVSLVPLGSTGRLEIRGFPLATAWRFVQEEIALGEPAGHVDADVRYQFSYREGTPSLRVDGVEVAVGGLLLTQREDNAPLLALQEIRLTGGRGDLISRELTVPEVSVRGGRLAATIARDGTVNWQRLLITPPAASPAPAAGVAPAPADPSPATADAPPWRLAVEKVRVEELALSLADQSRAAPVEVDVGSLTLDASARLESGPAGLTGTAEGLGLTLARVEVREATAPGTPLVSLEQISVEGGHMDLGGRQLAVSRVAATGGATTVVRAPDGSLPLVTMLGAADQGPPAGRPARGPAPAAPTAARPWTLELGTLELADHRLAVTDRSVTPAAELEIEGMKASVRELRIDGKKPFPFDASFRVAQGGRLTASGRVAPDGRAAEARVTVAELALAPAQPYIATHAAVELRSGEVSTTGRLTYRGARDRARVSYTGSVDLDGVRVVEAATGDPVVAWKSLHAATLRFGLTPDRLEIDEVRLAGLDGRVVIFQDRSFNLAKLMAPPGTTPGAPSASGPAAAGEGGAAPRFPVLVERVRIDDSSMDFADLSLALPFETRVHELSGVVAGLGSDAGDRATVKLDGRVDEFGRVTVDGALSAFDPKAFTDIAVIFRNVPMPPLTPYSATFAGRRLVAGTMDLDLEYKVQQSALVGENKAILHQLRLGERVESPGATRLPLDLAIAILSDANGRINVAVPVRGNVDDPQFSYGQVIWRALVTVINRVVTSPFQALAGLLGGDAEQLQAIAFEAGSDTLLPPERQKLERVAEVLGNRPRLKITAHGGYDAKADGEALRSLRVRRDLAERLGVKLRPGEDPGPVAFDHAKTQRALEAMLTERGGARAVAEFQAHYEKSTGRETQRVNPLLALVDRGSQDRAFYEALFRRLVESAPLTDAELTALGQRRGEATARAVKEGAGAAAARVEVGDTRAAGRAERNLVPTRLELGPVGP